MAALWLHVGSHKTGTSTIQQACTDARAKLAAEGIAYPANPLGRTYRSRHPTGHHFVAESVAAGEVAAQLDAIGAAAGDAHTVVLSSEAFELMSADARHTLARAATERFNPVRVLLYLREPLSLAASRAATRIRLGLTRDADETAKPRRYHYRWQIEAFGAAFGDALTVRQFDTRALTGGDIVTDFLSVVGAGALGTIKAAARNVTPSLPAVLVMDALQRGERAAQNGKAIAAAQRLPGPRYTFPRAAFDKIARKSAADLAWLAETHGIALDSETPPPRESVGEVFSAETRTALGMLFGVDPAQFERLNAQPGRADADALAALAHRFEGLGPHSTGRAQG